MAALSNLTAFLEHEANISALSLRSCWDISVNNSLPSAANLALLASVVGASEFHAWFEASGADPGFVNGEFVLNARGKFLGGRAYF